MTGGTATPELGDITPFVYNEDRGGHPQVVQQTTRTEHFYNFFKGIFSKLSYCFPVVISQIITYLSY
ncbi:hypothetical protein CAEBREN_25451 [Caenorhabditis brenneri]|uniref:Uncharacterized protein n=1 Tax=Caenorhabditis brenneri TaxID=135651 RepID=G0PGR8_CAEBE|nr:hypothetical protein CAEBREN_25451 [Caenorhabditis brenneri]